VDTSPLSPLQPDLLVIIRKYLCLERGLKKDGAKPPLNISPPLEQIEIGQKMIYLFERGL
jgi:hypothetical protein